MCNGCGKLAPSLPCLCYIGSSSTMTVGPLTKTALVVLVVAMVVGSVTCACMETSTALTYNTGLSTTVHGYKERRSNVVEGLESLTDDVDFMCLQELWFEDDMKRVLDNLGNTFPHHYSTLHAAVGQLRTSSWDWRSFTLPGSKTKACDLMTLIGLMLCAATPGNCSAPENKRRCVIDKCGEDIFALSQDCRSCFSTASSGPTDLYSKCANVFKEYNRVNRPGLLVLSKRPLTHVEYVNYHEGYPVLLERGYIKAQVAGGPTYVCTHLTAVFPYYLEDKLTQFSNFLEEQEAEIRQLNDAFFNIPHVLLGDLNTGPERNEIGLPPLAGEASANYRILTEELHYQNPYLQNNGSCTYCPRENPVLLAENIDYGDLAIDLVMTSPGVSVDVTSATRVLGNPDVMRSDHFGVKVDICEP